MCEWRLFAGHKHAVVSIPAATDLETDSPIPVDVSAGDDKYDVTRGTGLKNERLVTDLEL